MKYISFSISILLICVIGVIINPVTTLASKTSESISLPTYSKRAQCYRYELYGSFFQRASLLKNGKEITERASVSIGDVLSLVPQFNDTDVQWFVSGAGLNSPYGHWVSGAGFGGVDYWGTYCNGRHDTISLGLSVAPTIPSYTFKGPCTQNGSICTVNGLGLIEATISFPPTPYSYYEEYINRGFGSSKGMDGVSIVSAGSASAANITFFVSAVPPTPSSITASCNASGDNVTVSYPASSGATYYKIYLDYLNHLSIYRHLFQNDNYTSLSFSYGVEPNRNYRAWVYACSASGCSSAAETSFNCTSAPTYSCTGTIPANATMFPNDNVNLTADTPYSYSSDDTGTRCQYHCDTRYSWNRLRCNLIPDPTVNLTINGYHKSTPTSKTLTKRSSLELQWESTDADSCTGAGGAFGLGISKTSGKVFATAESSQNYTVTCTNDKTGQSASDTVKVNLTCTPSCDESACSKSCGGGEKKRSCTGIDCNPYDQTVSCNTQACTQSSWREITPPSN